MQFGAIGPQILLLDVKYWGFVPVHETMLSAVLVIPHGASSMPEARILLCLLKKEDPRESNLMPQGMAGLSAKTQLQCHGLMNFTALFSDIALTTISES